MMARLYRTTLFAAYQCSLALGILLLPLALIVRRAGFSLPIDRLVTRLHDAHEAAADED